MIGETSMPFQVYLKHQFHSCSLDQYINSHSVVLTQRSGEAHIRAGAPQPISFLPGQDHFRRKGKKHPHDLHLAPLGGADTLFFFRI